MKKYEISIHEGVVRKFRAQEGSSRVIANLKTIRKGGYHHVVVVNDNRGSWKDKMDTIIDCEVSLL